MFDLEEMNLIDCLIKHFHLKADNPVSYLPATRELMSYVPS